MGLPDEHIHPTATGPAIKIVKAHEKEEAVVLHAGWFCPFVQRAWVALEEKRVPYQYIEENPYKKRKEFLAINPKGLVPALEHKGVALYESTVLLEYFDEAFPDTKPLYATSPAGRALDRIQIDYISKKIIPTFFKLVQAQEDSKRDEARQELVESLQEITQKVKGPFYAGEHFGAVDICIAPFFKRFYILEKHRGFKASEVGPDFEKWYKACIERPSMVNTSSDPEHYEEIYARYLANEAQSEMAKSTRGEKSHT